MKNLDKHEWDFTPDESYAIRWLESHGYEVTIRKRFVSKNYMTISKDGFDYDFDLPLGNPKRKYAAYMKLIDRNFEMARELAELRNEVSE